MVRENTQDSQTWDVINWLQTNPVSSFRFWLCWIWYLPHLLCWDIYIFIHQYYVQSYIFLFLLLKLIFYSDLLGFLFYFHMVPLNFYNFFFFVLMVTGFFLEFHLQQFWFYLYLLYYILIKLGNQKYIMYHIESLYNKKDHIYKIQNCYIRCDVNGVLSIIFKGIKIWSVIICHKNYIYCYVTL